MASPVTEWDAQGNPITASTGTAPTATEWDAQGNPISQQPQLDLSNSQGQGTYQMNDPTGKAVPVPYGQVQQAAQQGYQFSSDQDRFRFNKDSTADPGYKQRVIPTKAESTPEAHRAAVYAREDATGPLGQVVIGLGKAGGTIAKPIGDLASVVSGDDNPDTTDYTQARGGLQTAGKVAGLAAATAPALAEAPVATIAGLGTGTVSGKIGQVLGEHLGLNDRQAALLSDLFAVAGGIGGGLGAARLQGALSGAEAGAGAAASSEEEPGLLSQIKQGEDANQPMAQGAVRNAAKIGASNSGTSSDELLYNIDTKPILKNGETVLDDHLNALRSQEKAAYKQVDDTVGFDLKQEKAQLANDQYKLSQLGNTDTDINARGNLIEAINDSQARIAEAESKLQAAGIDPKLADNIHQTRMAGMDFKKALVRSTDPDGSVNVDRLLNQSKSLRFSKYGDRLQQFFGSTQAADEYMSRLQQAQELGVHAMKWQGIAKFLGKSIIGGGVAGLGYQFLKHQ